MAEGEILQSLGNILTRLALTNDNQLEQVLWKLVPAVLRQLKTPGVAIRNKVLQILSHVNKRLDGDDAVRLPFGELATLLCEADAERQMVLRSLVLVYLEKASKRSTAVERLDAFPQLMKGIGGRPLDQRMMLLRIGMMILEDYPPEERTEERAKKAKLEEPEELFSFLESIADRTVFVEFVLWTLLFQTKHHLSSHVEIVQNSESLVLSLEVHDVLASVPPGMSLEMVKATEGKETLTDAQWSRRKVGLLNFLRETDLREALFVPYLTATADPDAEVRKVGEDLLRRNFKIEMASKDLDLNDAAKVTLMMELFLGSAPSGTVPTGQTASSFRVPASLALKSKLLNVFVKSKEAANRYPQNRQVIWSCIFGQHVPMSLRLQAMEFSVWVIKHMNLETLSQAATSILDELLGLMERELAIPQRVYVYEAIGQLAQRIPGAFHGRLQTVEGLFAALETEAAGARSQLQVTVSSLASAFRTSASATTVAVKDLLLRSIHSESSAVRLVAVTWSMRLFPFDDCMARYICIVGAGDDRREVLTEARLGLDPASFTRETSSTSTSVVYPTISHFMAFVTKSSTWVRISLEKSTKVYGELISFLRRCHTSHAEDGRVDDASLTKLLELYQDALTKPFSDDLTVIALEAMVSLLKTNREAVAAWCGARIEVLLRLLHHTSRDIRMPCAQLIGVASDALSIQQVDSFIQKLSETLPVESKTKFEVKSGSIQALGFITASCSREVLLLKFAEITARQLAGVFGGSDPHLASTCALSVSYQITNPRFYSVLKEHFMNCRPSENFESWFKEQICGQIFQLCRNKDLAIAMKSALAVGLICKGLEEEALEEMCLMHLASLQNIKNDELQCSIGEALAFGMAKSTIPTDLILTSNFTSLRKADLQTASVPPTHDRNGVHGRVLDALLTGLTHTRTENRSACASHLITVMTYCPSNPAILERLEKAQNAFLGLLGDKNGITQEMASRGVSLIYSLGDAEAKSKLLSGLTSILRDPTKKGPMVKVDADTEVFAEGELGKAPGGAKLTTYKELCSLATDMGQPDLLYKFMDLANHQAALNSSRGAAAGFAHIANLACHDLRPYMGALLPRIYRMRFDPNPAVQETMESIWKSLVPDAKGTIEEHLAEILKELLTEMGSRLWRHRESSCYAMADLLQGRQWAQLTSAFEQIWRMAFRAADDIKESVRLSGLNLIKYLKTATLKFVDPHLTDAVAVAEAVSVILPVLLETTSSSKVGPVVGVAFSTISSIATSCPAEQLRPHLSLLIPSLIESLSSIESGKLDELQLQVAGAGMDAETLEAARVRASAQTPVQDILNRCVRMVDASTLEQGDLIAKLKDLIHRGVGLNTRVGTVTFVKQLSQYLGSEFQPHAQKFIKTILSKVLAGEASTTVMRAYASSLGGLCKVASAKAVGKMVDTCLSAVKADSDKMQIVGLIFKELHSSASTQFSDHASSIIPIAFLARFDSKTSVASVWGNVLEDGMGTEGGAIRLYHGELVQEIIEALGSSKWGTKVVAAKAIERMYKVDGALMEQHSASLLQVLMEQLPGRLWDGKEEILKALAKICMTTPSVVQQHSSSIVEALKQACSKGKKDYREVALECLADVVPHFGNKEVLYEKLASFLLSFAEEKQSTKDGGEEGRVTLPLTSVVKCLANVSSGLDFSRVQNPLDTQMFTLFHSLLASPRAWHIKLSILESVTCFLKGTTFHESEMPSCLENLIAGAFVCLEEQKYEQLRLKTVHTLEAIAECAGRHNCETIPEHLGSQLQRHMEAERSITVKIKISSLLKSFAQPTSL